MKAPSYLRSAAGVLLRLVKAVLTVCSASVLTTLLLWGVGRWRDITASGSTVGAWLSSLIQRLPSTVRTSDLLTTLVLFFRTYDSSFTRFFLGAGAAAACSILLSLAELAGLLFLALQRDGTRPLRVAHTIRGFASLLEAGLSVYMGVRLWQMVSKSSVQTVLRLRPDMKYAVIVLGTLLALSFILLLLRACWHKDCSHLLRTVHGDLSALGGQSPKGHLRGLSLLLCLIMLPIFVLLLLAGTGTIGDLQQIADCFDTVRSYLPELWTLIAPWASRVRLACLTPALAVLLQMLMLFLTARFTLSVREGKRE